MVTFYLYSDHGTRQSKLLRRKPTQAEYDNVAQGDAALFKLDMTAFLDRASQQIMELTVSECCGDNDWNEIPTEHG